MQGVKLTKSQTSQTLKALAAGSSGREVAKKMGISEATVSKLKNKKESREFIEKESARLLNSLPDLIEAAARDFETGNRISKYISGEPDHGIDVILSRLTKVRYGKDGQVIGEDPIDALLKTYEIISRKGEKYLQAVGILPCHTPSIFVQQIFRDNPTEIYSPAVLKALGAHLDSQLSDSQDDKSIEVVYRNEEEIESKGDD